MRVGNDRRDVVQWHLAQFFALAVRVLHHHEAAVHEQVTTIVGHFDDAAEHRAIP